MSDSIWNKNRWKLSARKVAMATQNALELIAVGRFSKPYSAGFDVLYSDYRYSLRRYQGTLAAQKQSSAPLLLIPPLMLTAEIYDISAELSAAATLVREGVDVWVCDFRAPENEEGGLARTLDDHVLAVGDAIDRIREITRRDVHLGGYSQGGMFAYQCAAHRHSAGIASVIAFGSPVDIHRSVPSFSDAFAERVTQAMRTVLGGPIAKVEGLPGTLSSLGFKLMGMKKEATQIAEFLSQLHDRQALEKREAKRLFLRGDGFVAWPGPAFRTFVDEFIVANRMSTGGFVIDGKTVSLADITCPILCFVGARDEMASPGAVRAIHTAAPNAEISEVTIAAGHFGLVVGSESLRRTWPTVTEWIRWMDGAGDKPAILSEAGPTQEKAVDEEKTEMGDAELVLDVASKLLKSAWHRAAETAEQLSESADTVRYQMPRLRKLRTMQGGTQVSFSLALSEQAKEIPEQTFFLWQGRAFTYAATNARVDNVVRGLIACGVLPTQRVGVLMDGRPSFLTMIGALNRIGAVSVLIDPKLSESAMEDAFQIADVAVLVVDPEHAEKGSRIFPGQTLVLGGTGHKERASSSAWVDLEAIEPSAVKLPAWYLSDPGRARDLAMIIISEKRGGKARALHVSNHRWAFSAYGAAAAATLHGKDTVYCCLPLHHAAGTMVSVSSALVSGARLALAEGFSPDRFWSETRRYGVTVVFYAGEMCRQLVDAAHTRNEKGHAIRLFAGSGMREDVWRRMMKRFGPLGILEFYASTETNTVLANASGQKAGSVGTPMPGSRPIALVQYDVTSGKVVRRADGYCVRCTSGEIGLLLTKIKVRECSELRSKRVLRGVFSEEDAWYSSDTLLRKDEEGDYWFVERLSDLVPSKAGPLFCMPIESALYATGQYSLVAAYGVPDPSAPGAQVLVAAVQLREGQSLDTAQLDLALAECEWKTKPRQVVVVSEIPLSDGFRPVKAWLKAEGLQPRSALQRFHLNEGSGGYEKVS